MNTKFLTAGIVLIAAFSSNANALTISGWKLTIGSLDATIDLQGVPNPDTKPTVAVGSATLDQIEYLCYNPSNFNVAPGSAGQRTFNTNQAIDSSNLNTDQKGKATVGLTFYGDEPGFSLGPYPCVNPNWTYIPNSAVAKQVTVKLDYYYCAPESKNDPRPCYEGDTNVLTYTTVKASTVTGVCTLNPVLRYADGTVVKGQDYNCMQTSP